MDGHFSNKQRELESTSFMLSASSIYLSTKGYRQSFEGSCSTYLLLVDHINNNHEAAISRRAHVFSVRNITRLSGGCRYWPIASKGILKRMSLMGVSHQQQETMFMCLFGAIKVYALLKAFVVKYCSLPLDFGDSLIQMDYLTLKASE
ncbi:predicted protein [Lichtheimia corymbifera JMRC:FSU:9682]|uniref:Uncharacterized protein n=1 Tax=Lichtheimia corymbifera JMRC:FSU:9682 TaxID=1263082 RepID=A0A068RR13_9FUNG|nr:predicted protein [Lichtheimia corymbifera JMRC:FSU:9682]